MIGTDRLRLLNSGPSLQDVIFRVAVMGDLTDDDVAERIEFITLFFASPI